jgi:hypothetical protein
VTQPLLPEFIRARSLYEVTGDIRDVNTMLVNRGVLRAALSAVEALGQQAEPAAHNRCGCNHWTTPKCPSRNCPWQGKRPVDAALQQQEAGSLSDAARVLAEFAKTAPGRLPQRVQDAIGVALACAPSPTEPKAAECVALPCATFREGNWSHPDGDGSRILGWRIPAVDVKRMGAAAYHLPREVADALGRLAAAHGMKESDRG